MRDDIAPVNLGKAGEYDKGFFWRSYRDLEMFLTRLLSKGPLRVSTLEADSVVVNGSEALTDAPNDSKSYVRKNNNWVVLPPAIPMMEFTYNSSTSPPPGNGQVRMNNSDQTLAVTIWFDYDTATGIAVGNILKLVPAGMSIILQDKDDETKWQAYNTSGAANDASTYMQISVIWQQGGSALTSGQRVIVYFGSAL